MKKFAFTLMELLTSLAIIGITAALVAPALTGIMPDKTKMRVIKAHKVLSDATQDLLSDPSLYRDAQCKTLVSGNEVLCTGLAYHVMPLINPYNTSEYSGYGKYPMLLASKMELSGEIDSSPIDGKAVFTTVDGIKWEVDLDEEGEAESSAYIGYVVTIDLNGDKEPNTIATSKDVKNPDQFKFHVDNNGKVTAEEHDSLTAQYLKTRTKFNNKKEDYKAAFGS